MTLLTLFLSMLKIGAFTFGGGYAMIALLQREFVENKKWLTSEEFFDLVAIAESTPGPIAINSSTYIGYKVGKFWGSVVGTLGMALPSFVIIFTISLFFDRFLSLTYVGYAFRGIQIGVTYLILSAGIKMAKKLKKTPLTILLLVAVIGTMVTLSLLSARFSSIFYILIAGVIGLAAFAWNEVKNRNRGQENAPVPCEPAEEPTDETARESSENAHTYEQKRDDDPSGKGGEDV